MCMLDMRCRWRRDATAAPRAAARGEAIPDTWATTPTDPNHRPAGGVLRAVLQAIGGRKGRGAGRHARPVRGRGLAGAAMLYVRVGDNHKDPGARPVCRAGVHRDRHKPAGIPFRGAGGATGSRGAVFCGDVRRPLAGGPARRLPGARAEYSSVIRSGPRAGPPDGAGQVPAAIPSTRPSDAGRSEGRRVAHPPDRNQASAPSVYLAHPRRYCATSASELYVAHRHAHASRHSHGVSTLNRPRVVIGLARVWVADASARAATVHHVGRLQAGDAQAHPSRGRFVHAADRMVYAGQLGQAL